MSAREWWLRRLLFAYPPRHRAEYAEEMLGVLMMTAGAVEIFNVLLAGVRTRLGGLRWDFRNDWWRDALAVVSLIAPLILLHTTAAQLRVFVTFLAEGQRVPSVYWSDVTMHTPIWLGWPTVLALAWWGGRLGRWMAILGATGLAVWTIQNDALNLIDTGSPYFGQTALNLLPILALIGLACSPGPRHGARVLGRRVSWALAAVVAAGFLIASLSDLNRPWVTESVSIDLWVWAAILAVSLVSLRTPTGRRAWALLAAPVLSAACTYGIEAPIATLVVHASPPNEAFSGISLNAGATSGPIIVFGFVVPVAVSLVLVAAFGLRSGAGASLGRD